MTKRLMTGVGLSVLAVAVGGCSVKRSKSGGTDSKVLSADLIVQDKFALNFAPNPDQPLFIQFVIANSPKRDVAWTVKTFRPDGTEVKDVFGTAIEDTITKQGGLFDRSVSLPMLVSPKTISGIVIEISVPELTDKEGKPLTKKTEFALVEGAYPSAHQTKESEFNAYAVVNEFLDPSSAKSASTFPEYAEALLVGAGAVDAKAGRDMSIIRDQKAYAIKHADDGRIVMSLNRDTVISWGKSFGLLDIYTNGHRLVMAGDGTDPGSDVRVFVGVKSEVRRNTQNVPELRFSMLKAPQVLPQSKMDEPQVNPTGYSASRGERGEAANTSERCDQILKSTVGRLNDFVLDRRGTCGQNFANLNGVNQTLVLRKQMSAKSVSVSPRGDMTVGALTSLVAIGTPEKSLSFFRTDVSDDATGAQTCGQSLEAGAEVRCALPQYQSDYFSFENNTYRANEAFLRDYLARAADPVMEGTYPGAGKVMVVAHDASVNTAAQAGAVLGIKGVKNAETADSQGVSFDSEESTYFGRASDWEQGQTAWHWAQTQCATQLNNNLKAGATLPGVRQVGGKIVARSEKVQFSKTVPNIFVIDSIDFAVNQSDAEVAFIPLNDDQIKNTNSPYKCTDNTNSLKDNACVTGDDFQLSPAARSDIRPLSDEVTLWGRAGRDGYPSPLMDVAFLGDTDWSKFDGMNQSLVGEAGPDGYPLKSTLKEGQFTVRVEDEHGKVVNDLLKPSVENPKYVEFYKTQVDLVSGTAVRAKYVVNGVDGRYEAAYKDVSQVSGKWSQPLNLDMISAFSVENNPVSVGANFGGVRTGRNAQFSDPLGGFWNLRKGKAPRFFNGMVAYDGNGGNSGGDSSSGGDSGGGRRSTRAVEITDKDRSPSQPTCPLSESPRVLRNVISEIDCAAAFRDGIPVAGYQGKVKPSGVWKTNFQAQFFITSANFPECLTQGGCASVPRQTDMGAVNGIEPEVLNCYGTSVNRFAEAWDSYNARLGSACMATPAFNARLDELKKRSAAEDFARACRGVNAVCNGAYEALIPLSGIHKLPDLQSSIANARSKRVSGKTELIIDSLLEKSSLEAIAREIRSFREAIGSSVNPGPMIRLLEEKHAEFGLGMAALLGASVVGNETSPAGFGSADEARQTLERYERSLADAEKVLAPHIGNLACTYSVTGTFRQFDKATPVSASFFPRKTRNSPDQETKTLAAYKYDDGLIQRKIVRPDVSPLVTKLVLKEESPAKPGKLSRPTTDFLIDCTDVGNRMLRLRLPLPKSMFAQCKFSPNVTTAQKGK